MLRHVGILFQDTVIAGVDEGIDDDAFFQRAVISNRGHGDGNVISYMGVVADGGFIFLAADDVNIISEDDTIAYANGAVFCVQHHVVATRNIVSEENIAFSI